MAKLRKQTHLEKTYKQVYGKKKKIKMLLAALGSVRIGKNCDLGLENAALGLWLKYVLFIDFRFLYIIVRQHTKHLLSI